MIQQTLYTADGRLVAVVMVPLPMPLVVDYQGNHYVWSHDRQRYETLDGVKPYFAQAVP